MTSAVLAGLPALARALGFCAVLPLGGASPRLALGLAAGGVLAARHPVALWTEVPLDLALPLLLEAALGAGLGLLAALPLWGARAVATSGGAAGPALGRLGQTWLWAVFFAAGGPAALLLGLEASFGAGGAGGAGLGAAAIASRGEALFTAVLLCATPGALVGLLLEPVAAMLERTVGGLPHTDLAVALRGLLSPVALALAAPLLADWVRALALGVPGGGP